MPSMLIKYSDLGTCWSPDRVFNTCEKCQRVDRCKQPEAVAGRVHNAKVIVANCEDRLEEAKQKLKDMV